jgi:uncharacterized membrane protein
MKASSGRRWYLGAVAALGCVLLLFRLSEYVAIWQGDSGRALFYQIGSDALGLLGLFLVLALITAIVMILARLCVWFLSRTRRSLVHRQVESVTFR